MARHYVRKFNFDVGLVDTAVISYVTMEFGVSEEEEVDLDEDDVDEGSTDSSACFVATIIRR